MGNLGNGFDLVVVASLPKSSHVVASTGSLVA